MKNKKIVLLAKKDYSTNVIFNSLKNEFNVAAIIIEEPISKKKVLKKRIKRLGAWTVFGQVLFQTLAVKFLNLISARRKKEIFRDYNLDYSNLPKEKIIHVTSVNSDNCLLNLQQLQPDMVIVNGTRIISGRILNCIPAKFVNVHVGITPFYRGVHGAYWALVNNDVGNCGITVHLVDTGIDTGSIIYQKNITITNKDNFVTYPLLQLAEAIPYLKKAITGILAEDLVLQNISEKGRLWSHPTIWQYIFYWLFHGKK